MMRWSVLALGFVVVVLMGCALVPLAGEPEVLWRVNCGAQEGYVDDEGNTWLADQQLREGADWGADGGMTVERWGITITGTPAPEVYLFERYNMAAYEFSVPNGTYTVRLHFAETWDGIAFEGERVFSVLVNGEKVLTDFDPFKEAGGLAKPIVKEVPNIKVTDGELVIEFEPNVQNPEINGIEVLQH